MARTRVKIDLTTTKSVIEELERFSKILFQGAEYTRGIIVKNWLKGKSPNSMPFKPLSTKEFFFNVGSKTNPKWETLPGGYKEFKERTGRQGIRNLTFTGLMIQGFKVFKKAAFRMVLGFTTPEINKARGNRTHAPDMMSVGPKLERKVIKFVEKKFWQGVK